LIEDNEHLSKICANQDITIKNLDNERLKLTVKNEELNNEIRSALSKLKLSEDSVAHSRLQNEETQRNNSRLQVIVLY
jgi:hypothetical protein